MKQLVEMHGGSIEAFSDGEGQGSEFLVRLPTPAPEVRESNAKNAAGAAVDPARRRSFLIVDDNRDAADVLGQLLELMGNEVLVTYDGESGIRAGRTFRPDVVLCDIGMPRMNGYDTARLIRGETWGKTALLVALSGYGQGDGRRGTDAGFDHHMVKPLDVHALFKLLA